MEARNDLRITFSYKHGCVRVYKTVIEALNHPKYVFFTWSEESKTLSLFGTDVRNNNCLLVERYREYKNTAGLKFSGKAFVRKIGTLADWDLTKTYVATGTISSSARAIEFDLVNAIPKTESSDGNKE